jgi:hypothetical protein
MARELERRVVELAQQVLGGTVQPTPSWLLRPGKSECGDSWRLISNIYNALTELVLPETMPSRERRIVDCVLKIGNDPPRIIEVDERQHFNGYRARTLRLYSKVPVAFDRNVWISHSEAKLRLEGGGFGRPRPPLFPGQWGRHQQRTFRDALADILPTLHGFMPTIRIAYFEVTDWIEASDARHRMTELLEQKFRCAAND